MKFKLISKKFAAVALAATLAIGSFAVSAAQFDGQFAADANQSNQSAQSDQSNQSAQKATYVKVKKASFKKSGMKAHYELNGKYYADEAATKEVTKKSLVIPKAVAKVSSVKYAGKNVTPKVVVKRSTGSTITSKKYVISKAKTVNIGVHYVTVKFKGADNYSGSVKKAFRINPKNAKTLAVKATGKKAVKVTWKKNSKKVSGYQVRYTVGKTTKTKTIRSAKKTSVKLTNLKKNKKYSVKIRSFKKVNGKTFFSTWSKAKTVKVK